MWQFLELFYREQGQEGTSYVDDSFLSRLAGQVSGLNVAAWKSDRSESALSSQVSGDEQAAAAAGANATPTLVIKGPGGTKALDGDVPYADVASAIAAVRA